VLNQFCSIEEPKSMCQKKTQSYASFSYVYY